MVRVRLAVERNWTAVSDDLAGRLALHRERAALLQRLIEELRLVVVDWGDTFADYPREEVIVEIRAPAEAVDAIVERATALIAARKLRDVKITVSRRREVSLRDFVAAGRSRTPAISRGLGPMAAPPPIFERPPSAAPIARNGEPATANGDGAPGDAPPGPPEEAPSGQPPAGPIKRPRVRRVVSTGFGESDRRSEPLTGNEPLRRSSRYIFWLEVGEKPMKGSIEETHQELVPLEELEEGAEFTVALFAFPDELVVDDARSTGLLAYRGDGRFVVVRQPGADRTGLPLDHPDIEYRMFFPLTTPAADGRARLRCNIYFRGVLVQSRLVTTYVGRVPAGRRARSARVDFQLAHLDSPRELAPIQPHALSLQLNSNGGATHSFRFASFTDGEEEIKNDAVLPATEIQDLITQSRGVMRKVAWGSTSAWKEGIHFRYAEKPYPNLTDDLFDLFRKGRQLYDAIINELAGGPVAAIALRKRMLVPGRVQVINTGSPSALIPTSLIYDYRNADPALGNLALCPAFNAAQGDGTPLEEAPCFKGECPSINVPQVVCPSGFWGYRHAIGVPVRSKWGPAPPLRMTFSGSPSLGFAYFPGFDLVDRHRDRILHQVPGWTLLPQADSYVGALAMLRARPNIAYFYCHGGLSTGNAPYLLVGADKTKPIFAPSLRLDEDEQDLYRLPRSLVILNGCETNAVEPNRAMKLVSSFVDNVAAAGVIGSEITISEELATAFGEELLRQLRASVEVGESIRRSRLALLKEGNPLGLVYLPLVAADAVLAEGPVS